MSSTLLKFISTTPDFIPEELNLSKAKSFIESIFTNLEIEFIITNDIEFIDPGSNFESVSCNYCGNFIEIETWQDAMDIAYEGNFKTLLFITPCCNKSTTLNELCYNWPAGFATFSILISDPVNDIKESEFLELEKILETKIRKISAHY